MEQRLTNYIDDEFLESYRQGFKASWTGEIYDWASENVVLPVGYNPCGKFDVNNSRYLKKPFEALNNPLVRQVNIMASPRSGKTLIAELFLLFSIVNNAGNLLWIQSTKKQSDKMKDSRMGKLLEMCEPVQNLINKSDRFAITNKKFKFANGMDVDLGSWTIKDLQSLGYQFVIGDEVWLADAGLIAEAKARTGDFPDTHKILFISQGGVAGDEWTGEFNSGQIWENAWTCPHCKHQQLFAFALRRDDGTYSGINWDQSAKIDGRWNYEMAGDSAELECFKCRKRIQDTPDNRELLDKTSTYLLTSQGKESVQSFRWNALADKKVSWKVLVEEWLYANEQAEQENNYAFKEIFRQKRLALSIGEKEESPIIKFNDEVYDANLAWPEEKMRFLVCDVGAKRPYLWWLCRAAAANGESRGIERGTCDTFAELEQVRERLKVKRNKTFVDSGYNTSTIYTDCAKMGKEFNLGNGRKAWVSYIATKGDHVNQWEHRVDGKTIYKPHSQEQYQSVNLTNDPKYKRVVGCPFYTFSNLHYKNLLHHLISGKGAKWLAGYADDEYKKQMCSEVLVTETSKTGKSTQIWKKVSSKSRNEWWDLEVLALFAMSLNNLVSLTLEEKKEQQAINVANN